MFVADCHLTENEYSAVVHTVVVVDGAGAQHVNGEYRFVSMKNNAGCYERRGEYGGRADVRYTLYKCTLKNGAFQWFLSTTPDELDPGTAQDTDFYYALAKPTDKLPAAQWLRFNSALSQDPPPRVECIRYDSAETVQGDSSDSEREGDDNSQANGNDDELQSEVGVDSSFLSSNGDYYD